MAEMFKTLTFPNNAKGQQRKVEALQQASAEGWVVVSETITQGKFRGVRALCLYSVCAPCAFCAGSSAGEINVTLKKEETPVKEEAPMCSCEIDFDE